MPTRIFLADVKYEVKHKDKDSVNDVDDFMYLLIVIFTHIYWSYLDLDMPYEFEFHCLFTVIYLYFCISLFLEYSHLYFMG